MQKENKHNPYSDKRFIGFVTFVSPGVTKVHFPSSLLLKKFFDDSYSYQALTGSYVIVEGPDYGFLGKIIEVGLPEKERLDLTESKFEKQDFHPTGKIEILLCFNNYELKGKKGLDQLPTVSAKVFLCSNSFLGHLLADFGQKKKKQGEPERDNLISLAHLPNDEQQQILVSADALFGRHCAVLGTTGGGKSWTVAKLIEQIVEKNGKAILIDATGEYETLKSQKIQYFKFNSPTESGIHFKYESLRETDLFALFRPSQQSQLPKLQEAMKSLRLVQLLEINPIPSDSDEDGETRDFIKSNPNGFKILEKKGGINDFPILASFKRNPAVYSQKCAFDILALANQLIKECVNENNALNNCQSLISRILLTINQESFSNVFQFRKSVVESSRDLEAIYSDFVKDPEKNILILSVADVPTENKLKEILVNSIGRFLLERALSKEFKDRKKSLLIFLDEAHLFLNKKIKDEYSIEVELDAFDRIAKECRKFGLFLVISTQMPRDIPRSVLSQMGTFIVHRLINQQDREAIEYACSEANKSALSFLPILSSGEAMLTGVDFPMPIILKINQPIVEPDSDTPPVF